MAWMGRMRIPKRTFVGAWSPMVRISVSSDFELYGSGGFSIALYVLFVILMVCSHREFERSYCADLEFGRFFLL